MYRTVLSLALVATSAAGCTRLQDGWRFFVSHCPADGPVREARFQIHLEPVDLGRYYGDLRAASQGLAVHELARIAAPDGDLPIYLIGPVGRSASPRILVVAGVHGNEIAASLAAPRILQDARDHPHLYQGCGLYLVAPANPVGLAHQSRYEAHGCDINRDFGAFRTVEAGAIRSAFEQVAPALVVALHEGPQTGFYLIATSATPATLPKTVVASLRKAGVALSDTTFLGTGLSEAGYDHEGRAKTLLKRMIRLHSLGAFANGSGVGVVTTESPWSSTDLPARIETHVVAVRAVCEAARQAVGSGARPTTPISVSNRSPP